MNKKSIIFGVLLTSLSVTSSALSKDSDQAVFEEELQTEDSSNYEDFYNGPLYSVEDGTTISDLSNVFNNTTNYLSTKFPAYSWKKNSTCTTNEITAGDPIEMKSVYFPRADIETALTNENLLGRTSYGGCGPIACIGVLDYFARYLGFNQIMKDPTNSKDRINLAAEYFRYTNFDNVFSSICDAFGGTYVTANDCAKAFNKVIENHGLSKTISCEVFDSPTLYNTYNKKIMESINKGIPVTVLTGINSSGFDGELFAHYYNVYGYEEWHGTCTGKESMALVFYKTRLNLNDSRTLYFDGTLLTAGYYPTAILTYDIKSYSTIKFNDHHFKEELVNSSGGGQYFNYEKVFNYDRGTEISLTNGLYANARTKRCSFIENQYLVLSANKRNAGEAYLDMEFPMKFSYLTFSAAMWSNNEGVEKETFYVQYYDESKGYFVIYKEIALDTLTVKEQKAKSFTFLFPRGTKRIKFLATHSSPSGDRNKGRVCLDNFEIKFSY